MADPQTQTANTNSSSPTPRQPILDLDKLYSGGWIALFGERHRLKAPDRVAPLHRHYINVAGKRLTELDAKTEHLTEDEKAEYSAVLDQCTRYVLDAPDAFHQRLDDGYRETILQAFSVLPLASLGLAGAVQLTEASANATPPTPTTGASSFPGSAASTAAIPGVGSRKSRRASSRRAR